MIVVPFDLTPSGPMLVMAVSASGPAERRISVKALVDTCADMSVVSPRIVGLTRPSLLRTYPIERPGVGLTLEDSYDVRFHFSSPDGDLRGFGVEALMIQPAAEEVDVIIGTDLLYRFDAIWEGLAKSGSLFIP